MNAFAHHAGNYTPEIKRPEIPMNWMRKTLIGVIGVIAIGGIITVSGLKDATDPLCTGYSVKVCPVPEPPPADMPHVDHGPANGSAVTITRTISPTTVELGPSTLPTKWWLP